MLILAPFVATENIKTKNSVENPVIIYVHLSLEKNGPFAIINGINADMLKANIAITNWRTALSKEIRAIIINAIDKSIHILLMISLLDRLYIVFVNIITKTRQIIEQQ